MLAHFNSDIKTHKVTMKSVWLGNVGKTNVCASFGNVG